MQFEKLLINMVESTPFALDQANTIFVVALVQKKIAITPLDAY